MKLLFRYFILLFAFVVQCDIVNAQYYKDIFMDGGIYLTSRRSLPAAKHLNLSIETYYSANHKKETLSAKDTLEQTAKLVTSDIDYNGCLLYPDGAPRFRVLYTNGGSSTKHGKSLTEEGRQHIRDFVTGGGSYVGTCAGAFISSLSNVAWDKKKKCPEERHFRRTKWQYYGIYPGRTVSTGLIDSYTDMKVEPSSPLLRYFDFGEDMRVEGIYHSGGCCLIEDDPRSFAPGTEILMRYDYDQKKDQARIEKGLYALTGKVSAWAWKKDEKTGRIVDCGSHPEGAREGERLDLFSSFVLYALDGNGVPRVKGELQRGKVRKMVKDTWDKDPDFTKIGDKQYHHFVVNIPDGVKNVVVKLSSPAKNIDMNLTMKHGDFAFCKDADFFANGKGSNKQLKILQPHSGLWYIGVECTTTITERVTDYGVAYTGHTEVLNGVPYAIKITWN